MQLFMIPLLSVCCEVFHSPPNFISHLSVTSLRLFLRRASPCPSNSAPAVRTCFILVRILSRDAQLGAGNSSMPAATATRPRSSTILSFLFIVTLLCTQQSTCFVHLFFSRSRYHGVHSTNWVLTFLQLVYFVLCLFHREKTTINYDVVLDPTLPRTYRARCPKCNHSEAVYYQSPVGKNDEALILVFVCVECNNKWLSSDE